MIAPKSGVKQVREGEEPALNVVGGTVMAYTRTHASRSTHSPTEGFTHTGALMNTQGVEASGKVRGLGRPMADLSEQAERSEYLANQGRKLKRHDFDEGQSQEKYGGSLCLK